MKSEINPENQKSNGKNQNSAVCGARSPVLPASGAVAKKLTPISVGKARPNPIKRIEIPDGGKPGQRRDEVAGMAWGEIDDRTWTIPKERAKNNKAHDVPLSDAALAIIEEVKASPRVYSPKGLLFTRTGDTAASGFSKAKTQLDKLMGKLSSWRLHDIRRTVATGMQKLHVPLEVTEAVLNHISGSRAGIVGIYQRHDYFEEKHRALQAWANHLTTLIEGQAENVVALRM